MSRIFEKGTISYIFEKQLYTNIPDFDVLTAEQFTNLGYFLHYIDDSVIPGKKHILGIIKISKDYLSIITKDFLYLEYNYEELILCDELSLDAKEEIIMILDQPPPYEKIENIEEIKDVSKEPSAPILEPLFN